MKDYYICPFMKAMENNLYRTEMTPNAMNIYTYPQNKQNGLNLIRGAVSGEREDELFYDYLISATTNQEAKNIITGIRNDERRHNIMFRRLYTDLTGKTLPKDQSNDFEKPKSYCDGLRNALMGELGAVQRYRQILFSLQNRTHINMVTEIITDELRHANMYNYLLGLGQCFR